MHALQVSEQGVPLGADFVGSDHLVPEPAPQESRGFLDDRTLAFFHQAEQIVDRLLCGPALIPSEVHLDGLNCLERRVPVPAHVRRVDAVGEQLGDLLPQLAGVGRGRVPGLGDQDKMLHQLTKGRVSDFVDQWELVSLGDGVPPRSNCPGILAKLEEVLDVSPAFGVSRGFTFDCDLREELL